MSASGPKDPDDSQAASIDPAATIDESEQTISAAAENTLLSGHQPDAGDDAPAPQFDARYQAAGELGRGGMGEVLLMNDQRIGREVALKSMRRTIAGAEATSRFLREAKVQGRLEHPAIPPVYDLGTAGDGSPYFTMKRLRGDTLRTILDSRSRGDAEAYSTRQLLAAFSRVCQAVESAHELGVLHRDLKPANIMFGDLGEVYVLDWGIARVRGEAAESLSGAEPIGSGDTTVGSLVGTPGYCAPEQARGELGALDERADVYSLGATLFEILTGERLHDGSNAVALVASTMAGADARASARFPEVEVPPELEALCVAATALDPTDRPPSARTLSDAIERFLDGDRDLERRRDLAAEHAERASAASDRGDRVTAMREAGRALALVPEQHRAADVIARLLLEPPDEIPEAVEKTLLEEEAAQSLLSTRKAALAYLMWIPFFSLFFWMGVKSWLPVGVIAGFLAVEVLIIVVMGRSERVSAGQVVFAATVNAVMLGAISRVLGPFILVPGMAVSTAIMLILNPAVRRGAIAAVTALSCAAILVPVALEWLGVLPSTFEFVGDALVIHSTALHLPKVAATVALVLAVLATVLGSAFATLSLKRDLRATHRQLHLQTWHLQHLVPDGARPQESSAKS